MELRAVIVLSLDEEKLMHSSWNMERLQSYLTHLLETTINDQMPDVIQAHFIQTKQGTEI